MSKKMLIEAIHPEETRMVVLDDSRLEELEVETSTKKQIKSNIYLGKIIRVEPALQAAFVEYGGNRQGFLAFNEIHPDYYQIPVADKEALKAELTAADSNMVDEIEKDTPATGSDNDEVETVSESEAEETSRPRYMILKKYKIQEVIHHNQIVLVQVVKEERGNKGAALTTFLSLAGRYSVLMPNNNRGGGVSRKITNAQDRRRIKEIVEDLPIPDGMAVIVRTAGKERTKSEIKRDFEYLTKTWTTIRDKTLASKAPTLIYEEGNIIKRSLRDILTDDVEEVIVEGTEAFKESKDFIKMLIPRQIKKLKEHTGDTPLFQTYGIENQFEEMHSPNVSLPSGGYIVINQTEALVAIDVNSGKSTRERNVEEMALQTNQEAADEIARQIRLRDLAGLVVIDFIDMEEIRNNHIVERRMKEALKRDRARLQMGHITGFGLMEISRQRLHSSFLETNHHTCPYCQGRGVVRSVESCAMHAVHILEDAAKQYPAHHLTLFLPMDVALYVLNAKRNNLSDIERANNVTIKVEGDVLLVHPTDFRLERISKTGGQLFITKNEEAFTNNNGETLSKRARRRRKRHGNGGGEQSGSTPLNTQNMPATTDNAQNKAPAVESGETTTAAPVQPADGQQPMGNGYKRRRRHRGGRGRNRHNNGNQAGVPSSSTTTEGFKVVEEAHLSAPQEEPTHHPSEPKKSGWWNKLVNS